MALGYPKTKAEIERFDREARGKTRTRRKLDEREQLIRSWVVGHRGVLSQIAREEGVSPQFVQMIAYGTGGRRSAGLRIERRLAAMGCPLGRRYWG